MEPDMSENAQAPTSRLLSRSRTHMIVFIILFFSAHSLDIPRFYINRDIYNRPDGKGYRLMIPQLLRCNDKEIER